MTHSIAEGRTYRANGVDLHVVVAGEGPDVLLEVTQYLDPVGKPWPAEYRICDQGILNIAFGARSKRDFDAVYRRAVDSGARPNSKPLHVPGSGVVYLNDAQGFSIEILWMKRGRANRDWGFEPQPMERRPALDHPWWSTVRSLIARARRSPNG